VNVTWDHFWLGVILTILLLLIVGILWLPDDLEETDADSADR
jgi:hypothetical protein